MVKPTKPIDIYVRVSRIAGRVNLISPDEQEQRAREFAREHGLTIGDVITDLDESGGKWERPGLQAALERVRAGVSGGIVVAWLDRLSRDSEHAHRLVRELDEAGGAVFAPDAPTDWASPEGELQAGVFFAFAQYQRKRARENFARADERSIAAGVPVNTRPPVGYRKREDRRLEPDPVTSPIIREAFTRRAAGEGFAAIARFLTDAEVQTAYGSKVWLPPTVAHVVGSRVYLGEIAYGKDRRYVNAAAHEPIVDLATWTAAQRPLVQPRATRGAYLLSGLLRCQACGYQMKGNTKRKGRVYRCSKRHAGGVCPAPAWTRAELIEEVVERLYLATDAAISGSAAPVDMTELEEAAARSQRRWEQSMTPEVQDAAGDGWAELIRERTADRDRDAAALGRARATQDRPPSDGGSLVSEWADCDMQERRTQLADWLDAIVLCRLTDGEPGVYLFPVGSRPDLRGRAKGTPALRPIELPDGAGVTLLHDSTKRFRGPRSVG